MVTSRNFFGSKLLTKLGLFALALALFFTFATNANAQQAGISIKPAIIEETLDPGTEKEYTITAENLTSTAQKYYVFTRNISGVMDGGTPIFAKDNYEITGYELADWIELPFSEIDLESGESVTISFKLTVPQDGSPGSHFGGVFFSVDPPEIEKSGAAVGYQVANIISIRVSGDVIEEAGIRQFSTSKFLYGSQNVEFEVRIENSGNVLIRPYGPLEVFNMLGNKVGDVMFNSERHAVFPQDTRQFRNIVWEGSSLGFGRYEAVLSPIYGEEGAVKTMSSTATFWILPLNIILPALGILATILLIVFIFVRLYIKRSIAHLSHGRRLVSRRRQNNSSALLLVIITTLTVTALFLIVLLALFA